MKIDKIKYDDKKSLFIITIEKDEFNISYELYEELELKEEDEISIDLYNKIEQESLYEEAKRIALNYLNYKRRTEFELITRLRRNIDNEDSIQKVLEYYKKLEFLDDKRYIKDYLQNALYNRTYSKNMAKSKLLNKGLDLNDINNALEEFSDEIEFENALELFEKRYKNIDLDDYKEKNKIYRYLAGRGFNYDIIGKVIDEKSRNR